MTHHAQGHTQALLTRHRARPRASRPHRPVQEGAQGDPRGQVANHQPRGEDGRRHPDRDAPRPHGRHRISGGVLPVLVADRDCDRSGACIHESRTTSSGGGVMISLVPTKKIMAAAEVRWPHLGAQAMSRAEQQFPDLFAVPPPPVPTVADGRRYRRSARRQDQYWTRKSDTELCAQCGRFPRKSPTHARCERCCEAQRRSTSKRKHRNISQSTAQQPKNDLDSRATTVSLTTEHEIAERLTDASEVGSTERTETHAPHTSAEAEA